MGRGGGEVDCDCRNICYRGNEVGVYMASHDGKYKNLDFYKINPFYNLEYRDFAHICFCVYNDLFYEKSMVLPF